MEWMCGSPAYEAALQLLSYMRAPGISVYAQRLVMYKHVQVAKCAKRLQEEDFEIMMTEADLTESEAEE